MYVCRYTPREDDWTLLRVLKKREMNLRVAEEFPEVGYLVFEEGAFIAAGFLRQVEGGYALIDGYLSDPAMPSEIRHVALDMVTARLIKAATKMKVKRILGFSLDSNTITRSLKHGFVQTSHTMITREI